MERKEPMPDTFLKFCRWFHQDIRHFYPSLDHAVSGFSAQLDAAGLTELKSHLGSLLASDASDEALQELWSECGAEWGVSPIRPFFERVRAQLSDRNGSRVRKV